MLLENKTLDLLKNALDKLENGFNLPSQSVDFDWAKMNDILLSTAEKLQNNYPYFHPLFAGQMLKPPHPMAQAAYMLAMWINPNNHALDGSKASSPMEKEAVAHIASMFGWSAHLGHLTGGGTMANLEALWVAGKIHPDKKIIASDQSHYTHERISEVLKLPFKKVPTDHQGRISVDHLEDLLKKGDVGTVVCTMATTGLGVVDPLDEIIALQKKYHFRIHADAAYGGYFKLLTNLNPKTQNKYELLSEVDSIVIDPHKHGLQPYGCGCILFKDPNIAQYYLHDSPYTYYTSDELHLGEISLECSRAGASAVGLWATHQLLPLEPNGSFAKDLERGRDAALELYDRLQKSDDFYPLIEPETDIVVWAVKGASTTQMSEKADSFFKKAEENDLYLSLYKFPTSKLKLDSITIDSEYLTCLRSCLMKPQHLDWMDELWKRMLRSL